jgi:hypothetical protein
VLTLSDTSVGDDALEYLPSFPKLKRVNLRNTNVTAEGLQTLRNACPNLKIIE